MASGPITSWQIEGEKVEVMTYFLFLGSKITVENSERDGNTRPPSLSPEKPVCSQEATVKILHGTTDWFKIGKGEPQSYKLSFCLLNLYEE